MFRLCLKDRSANTALASLFLLGSIAATPSAVSAQPVNGDKLDLSLVAARTICAELTMAARVSGSGPVGLRAAAAKTAPRLERTRRDCMTQKILRVSRPAADAALSPASQTLGFVKISARHSVDRVRGLDLSPTPDRNRPAGFQNAGFNAPAPAATHAIETGHTAALAPAALLPADPRGDARDRKLRPLLQDDEMDFVRPIEVSYTPPPGAETRFDPAKANGNLRKGVRWLSNLLTGEEG